MASSSGKSKEGLFYWIGGISILTLIALAVAPKLLGKKNGVVPTVAPAAVVPAVAAAPVAAVAAKPAYNYGVANSAYGRMNGYNFAGMALERPSNVFPLGFHLNNIQ